MRGTFLIQADDGPLTLVKGWLSEQFTDGGYLVIDITNPESPQSYTEDEGWQLVGSHYEWEGD